jgi:hypothetical protein
MDAKPQVIQCGTDKNKVVIGLDKVPILFLDVDMTLVLIAMLAKNVAKIVGNRKMVEDALAHPPTLLEIPEPPPGQGN